MPSADGDRSIGVEVNSPVTKVIVVGSLGELVKKSIEVDLRCTEDPKDRPTLLESASLRSLINEWPVLDAEEVFLLCRGMRFSIAKLQRAEKEGREILKKMREDPSYGDSNSFWFRHVVEEVFHRMDEVRYQIAELNKLSGGVGKASEIPQNVEFVIAKVG